MHYMSIMVKVKVCETCRETCKANWEVGGSEWVVNFEGKVEWCDFVEKLEWVVFGW